MNITMIYKNGQMLGAYRSFKKAMKELIADIQSVCPERSSASIIAKLNDEGSVDSKGFVDGYWWYYEMIEVNMEDDD